MLGLFFGCLLTAFGPALVFLIGVILNHSHLTILSIMAAFFELVAVLLTSLIWFAMPSTFSGRTVTALVIGVGFQEAMRFLFVYCYGKGEKGLAKASGMATLPFTDFSSSLSCGFGFGVMYALLVYGSILGQSVGEADFFSPSCPGTSIFLVEAFCVLLMQLLHVMLTIVAFDALRRDQQSSLTRFLRALVVFIFHLLASLSTLFNFDATLGGCNLGIPLLAGVVSLLSLYTFFLVRHSKYHSKTVFIASDRNSVQNSAGGVGS